MSEPFVLSRPFYTTESECGYCKDGKTANFLGVSPLPEAAAAPAKCTHVTIGSMVSMMSCGEYDKLINAGFRRSGGFLYKGDMLRGCCRLFTIRTKLDLMKVSKEHRQVVNRFKRAIEPSDKAKDTAGKKAKAFDLASLIEAEQQSPRFHTRYEPAGFSEEKYRLYEKYQTTVHNDKPEDVSRRSFARFLCDSPFPEEEQDGVEADFAELNSWVKNWSRAAAPKRPARVGPTHECYFLDGKLIAISVVDFLPTGISSVYFIWDPDYASLSLGTLSAIREVQMCHELGLGYYYMGYFIENCEKMRYKKKFGGELLDVCNGVYVPIEKLASVLKEDRFWTVSSTGHDEPGEAVQSVFDILSKQAGKSSSQSPKIQEPPLALSGTPGRWTKNIVNVADEIYQSEEVYVAAKDAQNGLQKLGVAEMSLPLVVPGFIPLPHIYAILAGPFKANPFRIFDCETGEMTEKPFAQFSGANKAAVVDFLRMYGVERTARGIILS